ncbi:hypothetical protein PSTT_04750 [Puccinia striiformis]|uniref:Uncharacterized protein n=1 Tax=Puccinia striiformis TaxID=27350 RepID=A0A2S4VRN7_9BASI|nr:hypothetical protein PSTT_04750 [Puccinia striiformis]
MSAAELQAARPLFTMVDRNIRPASDFLDFKGAFVATNTLKWSAPKPVTHSIHSAVALWGTYVLEGCVVGNRHLEMPFLECEEQTTDEALIGQIREGPPVFKGVGRITSVHRTHGKGSIDGHCNLFVKHEVGAYTVFGDEEITVKYVLPDGRGGPKFLEALERGQRGGLRVFLMVGRARMIQWLLSWQAQQLDDVNVKKSRYGDRRWFWHVANVVNAYDFFLRGMKIQACSS